MPIAPLRLRSVNHCPLRPDDRPFATVYAFRCFLQKAYPVHLGDMPAVDPRLTGYLQRHG